MARTVRAFRRATRRALLRRTPPSVREARRLLQEDVVARGVEPELAADAQAVLSELLANAIRHAEPLVDDEVEVGWGVGESDVEIRVTDGGGQDVPSVRQAGATDLGGRGLAIVDALAEEWGVADEPRGRTVWALVRLA